MTTQWDIQPGVYSMSMADYHASQGASKSKLDLVRQSTALVEWARDAPVDDEADAAVDIGSALHTLLLEPDQFDAQYVAAFVTPKHAISTIAELKAALDGRGIPYKAADSKSVLTATLLAADPSAPVADALQAEFERGIGARIVLSRAEHRKLILMRDSVMAHPTARKLLEIEGHTERCHYWIDDATGELCRARMDREIPRVGMILDLKTTGTIDRFSRSIKTYRYHCQDVFYREGYKATQGQSPDTFAFLAVSTTLDRKRYPVRLFQVTAADRDIGRLEIRQDLEAYSACRKSGEWDDIETISLPAWV